jgi:hypothetical protein
MLPTEKKKREPWKHKVKPLYSSPFAACDKKFSFSHELVSQSPLCVMPGHCHKGDEKFSKRAGAAAGREQK